MFSETHLNYLRAKSSDLQCAKFYNLALGQTDRLQGTSATGPTARLTHSGMFKPKRTKAVRELPDEYERKVLHTKGADIILRSNGSGPVVLFSHGWSGSAAQFYNLMQHTVNAGYRAVAIEHYTQNTRRGADSNYQQFIHNLRFTREYLLDMQTPAHAVVGHSIGGSASLHAFDARKTPLLLISPVIGVYERFRDCADSVGLCKKTFLAVVEAIESAHQICFAQIDEKKLLTDPEAQVHLLHSFNDRFVPASYSTHFQSKETHLGITVSNCGGHTSILNYASTGVAMLSWLARVQQNCVDR